MFGAANVSSAPKYVQLQGRFLKFIMIAGQKYKEKAPCVSDPNQYVDTKCNSKLRFS